MKYSALFGKWHNKICENEDFDYFKFFIIFKIFKENKSAKEQIYNNLEVISNDLCLIEHVKIKSKSPLLIL
jgi:hypothetical protein